jgi:enterochelin esterase family protein
MLLAALCLLRGTAADNYPLGPDSLERAPGVPAGRVEAFEFNDSKVFPGTRRAGWVYLPAQLDPAEPAALMVFQDGHAYVSTNGQIRAPIVFDNLIARGELPVTVGIFVNPGHRGEGGPAAGGWGDRNNRSVEYDTPGGDYARFLIEELIPFVTARYGLKLADDPERRAICGMSSGGICAWTAAWERPDYFRKVLSHIGSFVNIRGGHVYPALIRKTERKPIRVFLQGGANDLNNDHGHWPLANHEMAAALAYAGYDMQFVFGDGAHNGRHGGAVFPESVRWLFRPELPERPLPVVELVSGAWELVGEGYAFTDAACADAEGNFYFSDLPRGTLHKVAAAGGPPQPWLTDGPKISGMKFGPDGRLYAATQGQGTNTAKKIVAIDPAAKAVETLATDVNPNDLVVTSLGFLYFTDTGAGKLVRVPLTARGLSRPPPVSGGLRAPNGIGLAPDGRTVVVSEHQGTNLWHVTLAETGAAHGTERVGVIAAPAGRADSGGDGLAVAPSGRTWVTSHAGIQAFDPAGRRLGVIPRPQDQATVSCALAGPGHGWLYVCSRDKVYRRKVW